MTRLALALAGAAAGVLAGCGDNNVAVETAPPRVVQNVDEMVVRLTPPSAMNWDDRPGPDGLQVQVHFFQVDRPLAVTVAGELDFLLYKGRVSEAALPGRPPMRIWHFDRMGLDTHMGRSIVGWGYAMRLDWRDDPPTARTVTLVARYRSPEGPAKTSRPLYVAMGPQ